MTGNEVVSSHVPVLLEEVLEGLAIRQGGVYLDGTVGLGGHAIEILKRFESTSVIGLDRDADALKKAAERMAQYGDRVMLFHSDFRRLDEVLDEAGVDRCRWNTPGPGCFLHAAGRCWQRVLFFSGWAA